MQPKDKEKISLWRQMRQPWAPWARRTALFLGGQWISMLGSAVVQFAVLWYIQRITNSGSMLAIAMAFAFLPQALIAPVAGVWADRFDRKKMIIAADLGIAVATLAMAILFVTGHNNIWWLFLLCGVRGLGSGIQAPAVSAVLPQLVPEEHLMRANSINASAQAFTTLIPPVISVVMMDALPMAAIFFLDVVTAAIGIGMFLSLKLPRHVGQENTQPVRPWHELREGLLYTWTTRPVRVLLFFYALTMFLIVPVAMLTPLMVQRTFGMATWRLAANEISYGLGSMIGGALIAAWGGWRNRTLTIAVATVLMGLLTALLGLPMRFLFYLALMAALGLWVPFYSSPCITMLQENVEPAYMARVFSLVQVISTLCFPLGLAISGPMSDYMDIQILLIISGAALVVEGGLMMRSKRFVAAGEPLEQPDADC